MPLPKKKPKPLVKPIKPRIPKQATILNKLMFEQKNSVFGEYKKYQALSRKFGEKSQEALIAHASWIKRSITLSHTYWKVLQTNIARLETTLTRASRKNAAKYKKELKLLKDKLEKHENTMTDLHEQLSVVAEDLQEKLLRK